MSDEAEDVDDGGDEDDDPDFGEDTGLAERIAELEATAGDLDRRVTALERRKATDADATGAK